MKKHDMVPDHSLFEALAAATIAITPKDHYKRLEEGSIVLKKSKTFSFCKDGVLVEGEPSPVKSDVVIFGTGFRGDDKIKDMFSSEYFRSVAVGSESTTVPLYRYICIYIFLTICPNLNSRSWPSFMNRAKFSNMHVSQTEIA
jgi:dimethylaniline monooxygenase (N-oxide forming)